MKRRVLLALALVAGVVVAMLGVVALRYLVWAGEVEEVRFESADGTEIVGNLVLPDGPAPFPAIVLLHGSGPDTRGLPGYRIHVQPLVRAGFAVLTYDKRGAGASGGKFEETTYANFVDDAIAGVAFLRNRSDVDPDRLGLLGFSEGGWLTPEVAERSGGIAFIINKCGSPLSWIDTVLWEVENELRDDGIDGAMLDRRIALRVNIWNYYISASQIGYEAASLSREMIEAQIASLQSDPIFAADPVKLLPYDSLAYSRYAAKIAYDPTPFLLRTPIPTLYVFAEDDVNLPTFEAIDHLETYQSVGFTNLSYRVYPGLGHSLQKWTRFWNAGYPADYFDLIISWARENSRSQNSNTKLGVSSKDNRLNAVVSG